MPAPDFPTSRLASALALGIGALAMVGVALVHLRRHWLAGDLAQSASRYAGFELPGRTFHVLPTGNGHGFQLYDTQASRLIAFLDHPYRYLRAPEDLTQNGPQHRNLLREFSLGVRSSNAPTLWLQDWEKGDTRYLEQTNIVQAAGALGPAGPRIEAHYFSPFGLEKNALIAFFQPEPRRRARVREPATTLGALEFGVARLDFHLGDHPVSNDIWDTTLGIVPLPGERIDWIDGPWPAWIESGRGRGALIYLPLMPGARARCGLRETADGVKVEATAYNSELVLPPSAKPLCAGEEVVLELEAPGFARAHGQGGFGVLVQYVSDASKVPAELQSLLKWRAGRSGGDLLLHARAEFERWRKTPKVRFRSENERKLWRQSETLLRMGQIRENPRNFGMILASLPPGNWPMAWVRDAAFATVALSRMGHLAEARASLDFFLNAGPVGKFAHYTQSKDYRISVTRYFGTGEEEADYSGTESPNVELDGWGLVLWAARQYLDHSGHRAWLHTSTRKGSVFEALLEGVARPITENLEPHAPRIMRPDSSIWEVHDQNKRHFAFTTIAAFRGLCDFSRLAELAGRPQEARRFATLAEEVRQGFLATFPHEDGILGALERKPSTDLDAATITAFTFGVIPPARYSSELAQRALRSFDRLRVSTGGFKRNDGKDWYEINEWLISDFWMASTFYRVGRAAEADLLIERIVRASAEHFYILPEMYNVIPADGPVGAYIGAIPMVGYAAGIYVLALLDREGRFEGQACARQ